MGKRQKSLEFILQKKGTLTKGCLEYPSYEQVAASVYTDEVYRVYRQLGGILPDFPLNLRSWDLEFNGIALELDENLHFNRYRVITLESSVYKQLPKFPLDLYRSYSSTHEKECLRAGGYGGKWLNRSCELQFGPGAKPKCLSGNGAPRWKQRAFYDFVKDLAPLIIGIPVVRISVWDEVEYSGEISRINEILLNQSMSMAEALVELIFMRMPIGERPTSL